ncbi:MAG: hypothetical protein O3B90_01860 [Actinomycetota bacterium]|uniref:hypothetical protein n=1 Tax=uncultured Ilumatobacter sp. TaxID=879968 RepID=UPI00374F2DAB|nr:hypothetical protein [Actinomycetota bacterium]
MPGPDAADRTDLSLIQQLTVVGWLLLGGQFGFMLFQFERVRTADGTRFATAWGQRIEVLSFMMLPPNLVVLFPAAAVAIGTTWLAGSAQRGAWLNSLLRVIAGIAVSMIFIGFAAIIEISTRIGQLELDSIFLRLGGMSLAAGIALGCRLAEQHHV